MHFLLYKTKKCNKNTSSIQSFTVVKKFQYYRTGSVAFKGCFSLISPGLELDVEFPAFGKGPFANIEASLFTL